jgi:hypothetical protein
MSDYFGSSSEAHSMDNYNVQIAERFENTVGDGTLTQIEVDYDGAGGGGSVKMAVYSDNSGNPNALLLDCGEVALDVGWNVIDGLSLGVTSGVYYWLAFCTENNWNYTFWDTGAANSNAYNYTSGNYANFPLSTFPTPDGKNANQYTLRAWVETGGGGGWIPFPLSEERGARGGLKALSGGKQ